MEPESGHVGSTLQKTRKIQILCDFSGGNCGQTELVEPAEGQ